jgi:hypothetical protein
MSDWDLLSHYEKFIRDAEVEIRLNRAAPDFRFTIGLTWFFKP